jgi:hypothetical protein
MKNCKRILLAVLALLAGGLRAQEEAATLARLCDEATAVAVVDVLAHTDPDPSTHEVRFRAREVLKGSIPAQFAIREPSGACCGRALFGVLPGTRHLLFLDLVEGAWHLRAGARGLAGAEPALRAHVARLLASAGPERLLALAQALDSDHDRVRRDAAMALASAPGLEAGAEPVRAALAAAAGRALATLQADSVLPYLVLAAARVGADSVLPTLVDAWVLDGRAELRVLVSSTLTRFGDARAAAAVAARMRGDGAQRLRAAELLGALDSEEARSALLGLLGDDPDPRLRVRACELLLRQGVGKGTLRRHAGAQVLELAERRAAVPPRLPNLPPEGGG